MGESGPGGFGKVGSKNGNGLDGGTLGNTGGAVCPGEYDGGAVCPGEYDGGGANWAGDDCDPNTIARSVNCQSGAALITHLAKKGSICWSVQAQTPSRALRLSVVSVRRDEWIKRIIGRHRPRPIPRFIASPLLPHLHRSPFHRSPFIALHSSLPFHRSPFIALHSSLPLHRSPFHRPIFIQRRASTQPARWANGSRRAEVCRMRRLTGPAGQRAQRRARAVGDATTGACRALHARCDGTTSLGVGGGSSALALAGMPGQIRVVRMSCLPVLHMMKRCPICSSVRQRLAGRVP
jgi:hypothetical protein